MNTINKKIPKYLCWLSLFVCLLIICACDTGNDNNSDLYQGKLVNSTRVMDFTATEVASVIMEYFSGTGIDVTDMIKQSCPVSAYTIEYCTKDTNGSWIIASGLAAFPASADGVYPVVQYHHGTQFNN